MEENFFDKTISVTHEISYRELINQLVQNPDDIPNFVANLVDECQLWHITAKLIRHFKAKEEELILELKQQKERNDGFRFDNSEINFNPMLINTSDD